MNILKRWPLLLLTGATLCAVTLGLVRQRSQSPLQPPSRFVQTPHNIDSLSFGSQGKLLLAAQGNSAGGVSLWSADGVPLHRWRGGGEQVWFSSDGLHVLTTEYLAQREATRCVWRDAKTGKMLRQWEVEGFVTTVSRDLSLLLNSSDSPPLKAQPKTPPASLLRVVEIPTGRVIRQFTFPQSAYDFGMRFSRDGRYLCVPDNKEASQVLRISDGAPLLPLPPLQRVVLSPDNRLVLGLSKDATLHLWVLPSKQHTSVATGLQSAQWCYRLPNGRIVINGVQLGKEHQEVVQVRSPDGTTLLHTLIGRTESVSPSGQFVAFEVYPAGGRGNTGSDSAFFDIQDVNTGQSLAHLDISTDAIGGPAPHNGFGQEQLEFSSDDRHVAVATSDGVLRFYDLKKPGRQIRGVLSTAAGRQVIAFQAEFFDALVLPDGKVAASGSDDRYAGTRFVRVATPAGKVSSYAASVGNGDVSVLGVSPDGKTLVGSSQWGIWQLNLARGTRKETPASVDAKGEQYYSLHGEGYPIWPRGLAGPVAVLASGDFSNGPVTLTSWSGRQTQQSVKVLAPKEMLKGKHRFEVADALPSPDGRKVVVVWNGIKHEKPGPDKVPVNSMTGEGVLEVRDVLSGKVLSTLELPAPGGFTGLTALGRPAWSKDASRLAMADDIGRGLVWDVASGRLLGQVSGTRTRVDSVSSAFARMDFNTTATLALTPDGRFLAAGRDDGTISLYSLRTFLPVAQLGKAQAKLRWMQFAPDGRTLYGVVTNGKAVLSWDVPKLSS